MHLKFKKRTSLLEQELQQSVTDYVILNVIVMSLAQLPQPHKLCTSDTNIMLGNRITFSTPDFSNYVAKWRWYATFAASVRSLQHHCRVTIRNQMGPCRLNLMHKLPLPVALQDYLLCRSCDPRKWCTWSSFILQWLSNAAFCIHSFRIFLWCLFKSTTTSRCSRLQHWYCVGVNTPKRYTQLSDWHAQGPYEAARVRFEPPDLRHRT